MIPIPCPDKPKPDEFGRYGIDHLRACSVIHAKPDTVRLSKIFHCKDSVLNFVRRANEQGLKPKMDTIY